MTELVDMGHENADMKVEIVGVVEKVDVKGFVETTLEFGRVVFGLVDMRDYMKKMVLANSFKKNLGDFSKIDYKC